LAQELHYAAGEEVALLYSISVETPEVVVSEEQIYLEE
jgi:hypothetical protein